MNTEYRIRVASNGFVMQEDDPAWRNSAVPVLVAETPEKLAEYVLQWARSRLQEEALQMPAQGHQP